MLISLSQRKVIMLGTILIVLLILMLLRAIPRGHTVADDLIVFAAVVVPDLTDKAAEITKKQGASDVVHFGNSVVTNY